jgi:hypothetical protein
MNSVNLIKGGAKRRRIGLRPRIGGILEPNLRF